MNNNIQTTAFPLKKKQVATISSNLPRDSNTDIDQKEGPVRRLFEREQLTDWLKSKAYSELYNFIELMGEVIKSKPISIEVELSTTTLKIIEIIQEIGSLIKEFPPTGNTSRYGNIVFRDFFAEICKRSDDYMISILKTKDEKIEHWKIVELSSYFKESFGNNTRIDYGTGHEAAFTAWMYVLHKMNLISKTEIIVFPSKIFPEYLEMIRSVQLTYKLEPAGARGVWGLDDYQFLPFLLGAHQLINHNIIQPKHIHSNEILKDYSDDYMYLKAIQFIKKVKKGNFGEHSSVLNGISTVEHWEKVKY
eukprot:gene8492-316_t